MTRKPPEHRYLGNALHDIESALKKGAVPVTLSVPQCEQLLAEFAEIVAKCNEATRENHDLRARIGNG